MNTKILEIKFSTCEKRKKNFKSMTSNPLWIGGAQKIANIFVCPFKEAKFRHGVVLLYLWSYKKIVAAAGSLFGRSKLLHRYLRERRAISYSHVQSGFLFGR